MLTLVPQNSSAEEEEAKEMAQTPTPLSIALGVWGDQSLRHSSMEAKGSRMTKIADDFKSSTAISRVPAYVNFYAEVQIVRCMHGTAIGLVVPNLELDQQWYVSRLIKKERVMRQAEFAAAQTEHEADRDTALVDRPAPAADSESQSLEQKEIASKASAGKNWMGERERVKTQQADAAKERNAVSKAAAAARRTQLACEHEIRQRAHELNCKVAQIRNLFKEVDFKINQMEAKLEDRWGPRLWCLTCDGLFCHGKECVETGVRYTDGDIVRLELTNHILVFSINGKEVPQTSCKVQVV